MKKYITILILSVFLFNIGGYYLWFSVLQYHVQNEIRQEIRKGLKEDDLTLIIVPAGGESSLRWIRPGKEFRYKGEMYDVVRTRNQHRQKQYYCIADTKEKQLIAAFSKAHASKKETEKRLKRIFSYSFYFQRYSFLANQYGTEVSFASIPVLYKSNTVYIHSPPPRSI